MSKESILEAFKDIFTEKRCLLDQLETYICQEVEKLPDLPDKLTTNKGLEVVRLEYSFRWYNVVYKTTDDQTPLVNSFVWIEGYCKQKFCKWDLQGKILYSFDFGNLCIT